MAGRKPKYPTEMLMEKLNEYIDNNPYIEIKLSSLADASNVPAHVWRDNSKLREVIDKVNKNPIVIQTSRREVTFPSAEDLIEANWNNKKKLTSAIQTFLDVLNDVYDKSRLYDTFKIKEEKLVEEINRQKSEITKLKSKNNDLRQEIDGLYLNSLSKKKREELGIVDNLIDFNKNKDQLSKDINKLKNSIDGLL